MIKYLTRRVNLSTIYLTFISECYHLVNATLVRTPFLLVLACANTQRASTIPSHFVNDCDVSTCVNSCCRSRQQLLHFPHVKIWMPGWMHTGCVLQRLSLGALANVTIKRNVLAWKISLSDTVYENNLDTSSALYALICLSSSDDDAYESIGGQVQIRCWSP